MAIRICGKGLKSPPQQKKSRVGVPNSAWGPTLQWSGNSCNVAGKCIGFHLSNRPFQRLRRHSTHHMGELVLHIHQALCRVLLGNQIVSSLPWICVHFFVSEKKRQHSAGDQIIISTTVPGLRARARSLQRQYAVSSQHQQSASDDK